MAARVFNYIAGISEFTRNAEIALTAAEEPILRFTKERKKSAQMAFARAAHAPKKRAQSASERRTLGAFPRWRNQHT